MSILFCRHGETVFNREDRYQGVSDSPLTDRGVTQARLLGAYLQKTFVPEKVFISPLPRVKKTIEIALQGSSIVVEEREDLREICYGSWEGVDKDTLRKLPEWSVRQKDRYSFVHPGEYEGQPGESYADLYARLIPFFSMLERETRQIAVCSHIGVLRSMLKYYQHLSDEEAGLLEIKQSLVFMLDKDGTVTTKDMEASA